MKTVGVCAVVHCSSEDPDHPASNILTKLNKSWRCSRTEAEVGRASITLELATATFIQYIDLVNAGSAFVQVDGLVTDGSAPVPILPMTMIMSQADCNTSNTSVDHTACHLYKRSDFARDSFRRFKYLVLSVSQPFKRGLPFGITCINITKPCYSSQIKTTTPSLSDPNKANEIEFSFMKKSRGPSPLAKVRGLNDAVSNEDFDMGKAAPMNKLTLKSSEKQTTPSRNAYFATINERHDFVYRTPRSSKKKTPSKDSISAVKDPENPEDKIDNNLESPSSTKSNKENLKSSNVEVTPSRKRKKSTLHIVETKSPRTAQTKKKRYMDLMKRNIPADNEKEEDPPDSPLSSDLSPSPPKQAKKQNKTPLSAKNKHNKTPLSAKNKHRASIALSPSTGWIDCSFKGDQSKHKNSPKVITIDDIVDDRPSRKSNKSADCLIIDHRKRIDAPLLTKNSAFRRKRIAHLDDNDDDVLICDPLPAKSRDPAKSKASSSDVSPGRQTIILDPAVKSFLRAPVPSRAEELAECPMCNMMVKKDLIQTHANNCLDAVLI